MYDLLSINVYFVYLIYTPITHINHLMPAIVQVFCSYET